MAIDPAQIIAPYLKAPEESIRCAAIRALSTVRDISVAPILVEALMDSDPDVRSDAMSALVYCARSQDAPALRYSLANDPVREVKIAAIQALSRIGDESSVALLRALVKDRCEQEIVWEQLGDDWDDWLDVQLTAIRALGDMGLRVAVHDLIQARNDETGQDIDHAVFAALAKIPDQGITALLHFLEDESSQIRERALTTLSRVGCDLLMPIRDRLIQDANPQVRQIAIGCLEDDEDVLAGLALNDPDAGVRCTALTRVRLSNPQVAQFALSDSDPAVRAIALESLAAQLERVNESSRNDLEAQHLIHSIPDFVARVEGWLRTEGLRLAGICAVVLPKLAGAGSLTALRETATDTQRPLKVRIAAFQALTQVGTDEVIDVLSSGLMDCSGQIRLAVLGVLVELTQTDSDHRGNRAREVLLNASRGISQYASEPDSTDHSADQVPEDADIEDKSAHADAEPAHPESTLKAMQIQVDQTIRVPPHVRTEIRAQDDSVSDVRLMALNLVADCAGDDIDESLAKAAESTMVQLEAAAVEALSRRVMTLPLSDRLVTILIRFLKHGDPMVRTAAIRALMYVPDDGGAITDSLTLLLSDHDAVVRASVVTAVAANRLEVLIDGFRDSSELVRRVAVDAAVRQSEHAALREGVKILVDEGRSESLIHASQQHTEVQKCLLEILNADLSLSRKQILMILDALGRITVIHPDFDDTM